MTEAAAPRHALLVTDRPFLEPVDGSTQTYLLWLQVLMDLGCRISVLSFNHRSVRWSAKDRARLEATTVSSLILEAHDGLYGALRDEAMSAAWRLVGGRRYLPAPVEGMLRRGHRARLVPFLHDGAFDVVVLNKLHTTALIGRRLFQSVPARKIIDMHDNYPLRETLNLRMLAGFARTDRRLFRAAFKPREVLQATSWAGQERKLGEEAARLGDFDHVVFNAPEEADAYMRAGLPRAKVEVLPLPYLKQHDARAVPEPRPYQVGLIASTTLFNIEGLAFLARQVMPILRARGVRLLIAGTVGRFAPMFMDPADGTVLGWVDDVATFYDQVEVVAVPLLTGTGVSVKTMEAAAYGAAIVSTQVGLRGLNLQAGTEVLVADDPATFAASILQVLDEPALRDALRRNSAAGLRREHSRATFTDSVARLLPPGNRSGG